MTSAEPLPTPAARAIAAAEADLASAERAVADATAARSAAAEALVALRAERERIEDTLTIGPAQRIGLVYRPPREALEEERRRAEVRLMQIPGELERAVAADGRTAAALAAAERIRRGARALLTEYRESPIVAAAAAAFAEAERTLGDLSRRKAEAETEIDALGEERAAISYAAKTGDQTAAARLATINDVLANSALDSEDLAAAIAEAEHRAALARRNLAAARADAALDRARGLARQVLDADTDIDGLIGRLAERLKERGALLDEIVRTRAQTNYPLDRLQRGVRIAGALAPLAGWCEIPDAKSHAGPLAGSDREILMGLRPPAIEPAAAA